MKKLLIALTILTIPTTVYMAQTSISNVQGTINSSIAFTPATAVAPGVAGVVPAEPTNPTLAYEILTNQTGGFAWQTAAQVKSAMNTTTRAYVLASNISGQSLPSLTNTVITNWTEAVDSTNSFNPTTGVFTAPRTGYYTVSVRLSLTSVATTVGTTFRLNVGVTGTPSRTIEVGTMFAQGTFTAQSSLNGSITVPMNAGETLGISFTNGAAIARPLAVGGSDNNLSIIEETQLQ